MQDSITTVARRGRDSPFTLNHDNHHFTRGAVTFGCLHDRNDAKSEINNCRVHTFGVHITHPHVPMFFVASKLEIFTHDGERPAEP